MIWGDDGEVYIGDFHLDLRHGNGVNRYADGSYYTGEF